MPHSIPPGLPSTVLAKSPANIDREPLATTVLSGLPHNVTTEMDLTLWELASLIRQDAAATRVLRDEEAAELSRRLHEGSLPAIAQHGVAEFLKRYGHRVVAEIDTGVPDRVVGRLHAAGKPNDHQTT